VLLFGPGVAWRLGGVVLVLCKCRDICSALWVVGKRGWDVEGKGESADFECWIPALGSALGK
jgi:hypothetical protein